MTANTDALEWYLRTQEFDQLARTLLNVKKDRDIAARLDVDPASLSLFRTGKREPTPRFMKAVCHHMQGVPFERLFGIKIREEAA